MLLNSNRGKSISPLFIDSIIDPKFSNRHGERPHHEEHGVNSHRINGEILPSHPMVVPLLVNPSPPKNQCTPRGKYPHCLTRLEKDTATNISQKINQSSDAKLQIIKQNQKKKKVGCEGPVQRNNLFLLLVMQQTERRTTCSP